MALQQGWIASGRPVPGCAGFTLVEAMVTLGVAGVLASMALPGLSRFLDQQRLESSVLRFVAHLQLARQTAITRGMRVTMTAIQSGGWEQGWVVFVDRNANAEADDGEEVLAQVDALPQGVRMRGNATVDRWLSFTPDGWPTRLNGAFQAGTVTACVQNTDGASVVMSRTGRIRIDRGSDPQRCVQ